jgi:spore coat polysaccharide biosynthesis protein SpsF
MVPGPVTPILCTSTEPENDELVALAQKEGIEVVRADEKNVLERLLLAIEKYQLDYVLRVTGDDILLDPYYAEKAIEHCTKNNYDYISCKDLPGGVECEVFSADALRLINRFAVDLSYTEYLTYYIDSPIFHCGNLPVPPEHQRNFSLTLDTEQDFKNLTRVIEKMGKNKADMNLENLLFHADEIYDNSPKVISQQDQKKISSIKKHTVLDLRFT